MWIADGWKDYELLDASDGERLERWGEYLLVRPDPQILWHTVKSDPRWRSADAVYHRSKSGGGSWEIRRLPETWSVSYRTLTFGLRAFSFKHTGLFPEQAVNWDWASSLIRRRTAEQRDGTPVRVLNLFAYTGGATLACASAGAAVTHVDASKGMVTWARENAAASGLKEAPIRYLVDDCLKFVQREIRRGNHYDAIIMAPPSYGRGPKGEVWKLEESIDGLLRETAKLLSDRPLFFLLNSYTTGLQAGVLTYLLRTALPSDGASVISDELGLPVGEPSGAVDTPGGAPRLVLPCGASGRVLWA